MAPAMVRKNAGSYIEQLVPLILQFMADLEDEDGWAESDEVLEEDNDCNNVVAEAALDRLACGLGKKEKHFHQNKCLFLIFLYL